MKHSARNHGSKEVRLQPCRSQRRQRAIAILAAAFLLCNAAIPAHADPTPPDTVRRATHFLENATFGPTRQRDRRRASVRDRRLARSSVRVARERDARRARHQSGARAAVPQHGQRPRPTAPARHVRAQPDHRRLREQDRQRPRADSVGAAALTHTPSATIARCSRTSRLSPTMGKFLDMAYSRKASATTSRRTRTTRASCCSFSPIGLWDLNQDGSLRRDGNNEPIPTYTQTTIREVARALTGWTFPTQPGSARRSNSNPQYFVGRMEPRPNNHDTGAKTFFGATSSGRSVTSRRHARDARRRLRASRTCRRLWPRG